MTRSSTPGGGSPLDEQIRRRREAQAEIQEQVLKQSLERCERLALASAERSSAALSTIYKDTERTLSDMAREADRELRRIRHPWLPALLGAALALAIQAAAMHWGWHLIRPQLEQQALSRSGLTMAIGPDGSRWILFPEGTATWDPADGQRSHMAEPRYLLIPDRS